MVADRKNPLPLYIQVRETIRREIASGVLPPGGQLMQEPELAERYGVSRITIKHALRDLAAEGLLVRIKCKGTFVSPRPTTSPVTPAPRRTKTLALIVPDIEDLFLSEIYRGVNDAARASGYRVLILGSDRQVTTEAENLRELGTRGEEGAVIFPNWGRGNAEQIFELKRRQFPLVLVNRYFRDIQTDYVVADNTAGACEAVEHLIQHGHRRIGCIGWVECTAVEDRLAGYRLALGRRGIVCEEKLVRSILDRDRDKYATIEPASGGYREMQELLRLTPRPTAVFAVSDRLAIGAMRAINEAGLRVGKDIALVGFDDLQYAADLDLSTVAQPAFETGRKAAEILIRKIESASRPETQTPDQPQAAFEQIVLPTRLVVRGTCGAKAPHGKDNGRAAQAVPT